MRSWQTGTLWMRVTQLGAQVRDCSSTVTGGPLRAVLVGAMPFFEDGDDPKKPRPIKSKQKREGYLERNESQKDADRDQHRHVHVRC